MQNPQTNHADRLPDAVRKLAERLGCDASKTVTHVELRQTGEMRADKSSKWMAFKAHQTIDTKRCAFDWTARAAPFGVMRIKDAFDAENGALSVSLFGVLPIMRARQSADLACGELVRYLAELPWAPDAVLQNRALSWRVVGDDHLKVSATSGDVGAEIDITLDADGLIEQVFAKDRPRAVGRDFKQQPWRGVFFDYQRRDGRLVPHRAEVGWMENGGVETVWRGELVDWRLF